MFRPLRGNAFVALVSLICVACSIAAADEPPLLVPPEPAPAVEVSPGTTEPPPLAQALLRRGVATMDDAYRVFAQLAVEQCRLPADYFPECRSFEELHEALVSICVVPHAWRVCSDDCLRRDSLALMAANFLGIKPGLLTRLFGPTRRYAHREMVFREYIAPGSPRGFVSGAELLSVVTRVANDAPDPVELTEDEIH